MTTIIIAAFASFIFGFLWYGPVFGKYWVKLMEMSPEDIAKGREKMRGFGSMARPMLISFVCSVITAKVVKYILPFSAVMSFGGFFHLILIIWFGFLLPINMNGYLWEGKSLKLVLFNCVYSILSFLLVSSIIYYV